MHKLLSNIVLIAVISFAEDSVSPVLPKAVLTLQSGWTEIFTTERATLRCDLQGGSSHWGYKWYRDEHEIGGNRAGDTYTISSAAQRDTGSYRCRGQYQNRVASTVSNHVQLTVLALPKAVLTLQSGWTEMFPTERATLRCDLQGGSSHWGYKWYRDEHEIGGNRAGDTYTIPSAAQRDTGRYSCRGQYKIRTVLSDKSNDVSLKVLGHTPNIVVKKHPPDGEIYTGESVTLSCSVEGSSTGWQFLWYKDTLEAGVSNTDSGRIDGSSYTIRSAAPSHSGQYRCQVGRGRDPFYTQFRTFLNLAITENIPKAQVNQYPSHEEVYIGESVTLSCGVEGSSTGWQFLWYKDTLEAVVSNTDSGRTDGSNYTISSAAPSHSGQYWCRAGRGTWLFYTNYSDCLMLNVSVHNDYTVNTEPSALST
ncbi:Fc receptor-like protein 5 isoform X1 [Arapaima gigas]